MNPLLIGCLLLFCHADDPAPVVKPAPLVPLWEQQRGIPPIRWVGDRIAEARQEALDRRVPILLWVLRDGDPASEAWGNQRLIDPDFISTLEKETVPAIVWLESREGKRHGEERIRDSEESPPRIRCPFLRGCRCQQHIGSEKLLEGIELPELLPAALVLGPDGKLSALPEKVPFQGTESLIHALAEHRKGPRSTRLNLEFIEIRLERAVSNFAIREMKNGAAELSEIERQLHRFGPRIRQRWLVACQPYLAYGNQMLRQAKKMRSSDPVRRLLMLKRIVQELGGLPPGKKARLLIEQASSN